LIQYDAMRIAISGAHGTGKTTLIDALAEALPDYEAVEEPYHLLVGEGHEFLEEPTVEDFELQLRRSLECLQAPRSNVIFDRCPADFLAYLTAGAGQALDLGDLPEVTAALATLDLIVLVPIETPDRISIPSDEYPRLRRHVDRRLQDLLLDDELELSTPVLVASGNVQQRVDAVLRALTSRT